MNTYSKYDIADFQRFGAELWFPLLASDLNIAPEGRRPRTHEACFTGETHPPELWETQQQLRRYTSGDRARVYVVSFHNDCKGASNTFTEFSV